VWFITATYSGWFIYVLQQKFFLSMSRNFVSGPRLLQRLKVQRRILLLILNTARMLVPSNRKTIQCLWRISKIYTRLYHKNPKSKQITIEYINSKNKNLSMCVVRGYHYSMTTDPENHDPGSSNLCYSMTIR